jgi:hypothetical protein
VPVGNRREWKKKRHQQRPKLFPILTDKGNINGKRPTKEPGGQGENGQAGVNRIITGETRWLLLSTPTLHR